MWLRLIVALAAAVCLAVPGGATATTSRAAAPLVELQTAFWLVDTDPDDADWTGVSPVRAATQQRLKTPTVLIGGD